MKQFICLISCVIVNVVTPPNVSASTLAAICSQPSCTYLPFLSSPPPPPIHVQESAIYNCAKYDVTYCAMVTVKSHSAQPVYDAVIEFRILNAVTGQLIKAITETPVLPAIFPGQYNYVQSYTGVSRNDHSSVRLETRVLSWSFTSTKTYLNAETVIDQIDYGNPIGMGATVTRTVRNTNPVTIYNVVTLVWCIPRAGFNNPDLEAQSLKPGQSQSTSQYLGGCRPPDPFSYPIHAIAQGTASP